jgi:hypothetical protein
VVSTEDSDVATNAAYNLPVREVKADSEVDNEENDDGSFDDDDDDDHNDDDDNDHDDASFT